MQILATYERDEDRYHVTVRGDHMSKHAEIIIDRCEVETFLSAIKMIEDHGGWSENWRLSMDTVADVPCAPSQVISQFKGENNETCSTD